MKEEMDLVHAQNGQLMDKLNDLQKEYKSCTDQLNLVQFYNERLKQENQEINQQILSLTEDL